MDVAVAAWNSPSHAEAEVFTRHVVEGPSIEVKELSSYQVVPCEKGGCTAASSQGTEILDLPHQLKLDVCVVLEENIHSNPVKSSLMHHAEADGVYTGGSLLREEGGGCCGSDDVGSNASFEFRVRSVASTPLSTPSTPMLSTALTPRHASHVDPPLTAQALVEIWEAFD
ncbi:hypothetical protein L7F22_061445 [Adiantum nelumboides]|nr:hypothetical protein [Adiantum nelumboides]